MNLATIPDRLKVQLSYLYLNVGEDLSFVVLTQERLEEMVQVSYYQGFGAGLVQAAFGHLSGDEVNNEQPRPGD